MRKRIFCYIQVCLPRIFSPIHMKAREYTDTHAHMNMLMLIHTHSHTHTYTHSYTHIHTHTHTHTTTSARALHLGQGSITYHAWLCSPLPGGSHHPKLMEILETSLCGVFWEGRSLIKYLDNVQSVN